ncbi:hypothetical protein ACRASX_07560 [Flavobacterium sp. TMP13]|uniref:hypothetical protein n=1 Tax=unclassified Flavobacterium TaxID=196869 RepID=UPI00076CD692|nr:hypothetical protein [Flavobacterium sp. TAB 87]KVV13987.1 hypothetical protein AP058_03357 [Flavobacterium sp. TAB 87]
MRTKIFDLAAPIAVLAFGFLGALQADATSKAESKTAPEWGYKHVNAPQNCERVQMCDNTGNFICTSDIDGSTLYELDAENPTSCPNVLKRSVQ